MFAIVFATRPAKFYCDPSNTRTAILVIVKEKHPLGSNILPFPERPKFTVIRHNVATRPAVS